MTPLARLRALFATPADRRRTLAAHPTDRPTTHDEQITLAMGVEWGWFIENPEETSK